MLDSDFMLTELKAMYDKEEGNEERRRLVYISVDKLFPHPDNPRKDLGDLSELTDSIIAKYPVITNSNKK